VRPVLNFVLRDVVRTQVMEREPLFNCTFFECLLNKLRPHRFEPVLRVAVILGLAPNPGTMEQ